MSTAIGNRVFCGQRKNLYVQGEQVDITGRLDIYIPGAKMRFVIIDDHSNTIYDETFPQPWNHGGYQEIFPPIAIFKSKPPYYKVTAYSEKMSDCKTFAYY